MIKGERVNTLDRSEQFVNSVCIILQTCSSAREFVQITFATLIWLFS